MKHIVQWFLLSNNLSCETEICGTCIHFIKKNATKLFRCSKPPVTCNHRVIITTRLHSPQAI